MTAVRLLDIYPTEHGCTYGYWKGCRCTECRYANTTAVRRWNRSKGVQPQGNPVAVNGRVYPTENAAGRALGVGGHVIRYHLDRYGDLSRIGQHYRGGCREGGRRIPFSLVGRSWPSISDFARYAGLSISTAHRWVKNGDMNSLIAALMKVEAKQSRVAA